MNITDQSATMTIESPPLASTDTKTANGEFAAPLG